MTIFLLCLFPVLGNIHGHTGYSDGCGTPYDAYSFAKSKGLKLYGLTEHSHRLDEIEWENVRVWADFFTDSTFISIFGQEVGKLNYFGHVNVYGENLNEIIPQKCWYNLDSLYEYLYKRNLIGIFNHPGKAYFKDFEFKSKYRDVICGIEIINRDSVYEKRCIEALSKGWELCFIASQDNHGWEWGIERNKRGRILQTAFLVEDFSRTGIFTSLRERRTYAFELFPDEDTIFIDFRVNDSVSGARIYNKTPMIRLFLEARAKIPFIKILIFIDSLVDSTFIYSNSIKIEKEYYLDYGKHFVFIKLIQADFDRVWVSPIFIYVETSTIIYPVIVKQPAFMHQGDILFILPDGRKIRSPHLTTGILFVKKDRIIQKIISLK